MEKPASKKSNRTLLYAGGGCVLVACLCIACIGGAFVFAGPQVQQVFDQVQNGLGNPSSSSGLPAPTAQSASGAPTAPRASATTAPTTASQPSGGGNPLDALTKSFTSWGSVKSFRAHVTTAGAPGEITMEVVMPDRFHINTGQAEMIMISNTTYVKIGNTWQKMNIPGGAGGFNPDSFSPKNFETQIQNLPDVKFLGADTVDGVPCTVYQITPKGGGTSSKFWIGVGDGFPHKIESANATITFTDFNGNITITAPIP